MLIRKISYCFLLFLIIIGLSEVNAFAVSSESSSFFLTGQEKEYFSEIETLRVLTAPDCPPYSYEETGVSLDILRRLCDSVGITLQQIPADNYVDALNRLENGEADLSAIKFSPHGNAENFLPYLRSPLQMVVHKNVSVAEQSELSIVQLPGIDFSYDDKYAYVNSLTVSSARECLDAVRSRRADIFLCDLYSLSAFSDRLNAMDLVMSGLPQREVEIGFGLREDTDYRLISALKRAVSSFSTAELSKSLRQHEQSKESGHKVIDFVYRNPFELLCALTSIFFVILMCIYVSFRVRAKQHQELKGYEDSYRMLANTFGEAGMEYDFLNDRLSLFGEHRSRIDLPETLEEVHEKLEQRLLRISLVPEELTDMLEKSIPGRSYEMELQCGMKTGGWNWFRMIYVVVSTSESHQRPIRLIGCLVNIEKEHTERERLLEKGNNDQLTGLLNRMAAEEKITAALSEIDELSVLIFLDIDNFKHFNDCYGHTCGDEVLSTLGAEIHEIFAEDSILCRWGGDEFLIFVKGERAKPDCIRLCARLLQERMQAFTFMGNRHPVTLSIGGAEASAEILFQELFELADAVLYEVKNGGRNNFLIKYQDCSTESSQGKEDM